MAHNLHVVIDLPSATGIPKNDVQNSWNFITAAAPTNTDLNSIQLALETFYNQPYGTVSHSLSNFFSTEISRTIHPTMKTYDKTGFENGTPSGGPIDVRSFALMQSRTGGTVDLPSEVAVALTFNSDFGTVPEFGPGKTRPRQRHRGRVYIGPLTTLALTSQAASGPIVSAEFIDTATTAAHNLVIDSLTVWAQWSRSDAVFRPVISGTIDNAPDTQRRRGEAATVRTVWV